MGNFVILLVYLKKKRAEDCDAFAGSYMNQSTHILQRIPPPPPIIIIIIIIIWLPAADVPDFFPFSPFSLSLTPSLSRGA